jgi:hypothetical protein
MTTKKVVKRAPTERYSLTVTFNDKTLKLKTDDLVETLLEIKPFQLKTRVILDVKDNVNKTKAEVFLLLLRGKMMFMNKLTISIFVQRLLFK